MRSRWGNLLKFNLIREGFRDEFLECGGEAARRAPPGPNDRTPRRKTDETRGPNVVVGLDDYPLLYCKSDSSVYQAFSSCLVFSWIFSFYFALIYL